MMKKWYKFSNYTIKRLMKEIETSLPVCWYHLKVGYSKNIDKIIVSIIECLVRLPTHSIMIPKLQKANPKWIKWDSLQT